MREATPPASKRLAVLTSGGDAPGMNAAIRAVTLVGRAAGWEVFGVRQGYQGLIEDQIDPLGPQDVQRIVREGGTILGSARCKAFHERATRDRARALLAAREISSLIVIGGNGSLTGALALSDPAEAGEDPVRVIGIPASIDNDLALTSLSIGVDTAMNTIVEACDKIADTASAHDRTFLIEVMGRECGYLAMTSAVAAGADMVLFPEAERGDDELVDDVCRAVEAVRKRAARDRRVIAIKAEGVRLPTAELKRRVDLELARRSVDPEHPVETRVTVLGHVVRGGRPSAFDRLLGSRLANVAVRALLAGKTRVMAAWMPPVELPAAIAARSPDDPYCFLVELPAVLAATEELLGGEGALARWRKAIFEQLDTVLLL
ncbi:MAG: 6-phosphofructokinase [Myxococcales bacterium]|nr:6-phosphofructokinase [Myxococcales bacterium]